MPSLPFDLETLLARMVEASEAFMAYIALNRNLSAHTIRAYEGDLKDFLPWLCQTLRETLAEQTLISEACLNTAFREVPGAYMGVLARRDLSRSSVARRLSAIRTFFRFLARERYLDGVTLPLSFRRPKTVHRLPDFLSVEEVERLLAATASLDDARARHRARAIVDVLFSSGLRVSELTALDMAAVHWEAGELRVTGKGGHERVAFVSDRALAALRLMAASRPDTQAPALFQNHRGERLTPRSVARLLTQLAEAAALGKAIHPHLFRHGFATHLLNHGVDLRVVQELLGHASIRSTQIYTHVTTERLRRAYLSAHPRAQMPSP